MGLTYHATPPHRPTEPRTTRLNNDVHSISDVKPTTTHGHVSCSMQQHLTHSTNTTSTSPTLLPSPTQEIAIIGSPRSTYSIRLRQHRTYTPSPTLATTYSTILDLYRRRSLKMRHIHNRRYIARVTNGAVILANPSCLACNKESPTIS